MTELWEKPEFVSNIGSYSPEYPNQSKDFVRRGINGTPTEAFHRIVEARSQTTDPEQLRGVMFSFYRAARYDAHHLGVSVAEIAHAIAMNDDEEYSNTDFSEFEEEGA